MKPHLEISPAAEAIGRDPREMAPGDLEALGHVRKPVLQALRERCVDCCGGSVFEVRACVAVACPSWPFRMGTDPWREKRVMSDDQKAVLRDRLAKSRAAKGGS